jgi:hypothetical protein
MPVAANRLAAFNLSVPVVRSNLSQRLAVEGAAHAHRAMCAVLF